MTIHSSNPFTSHGAHGATGFQSFDDLYEDFDENSSTPASEAAQRTRRLRAETEYHRTLVDLGALWLTDCARNGWTPADLRHEFTAQIDPLLFHALASITCNVPDQLLDHWFTDTRPGSVTSISVVSLEKIVNRLPLLPPLQDWKLLAGSPFDDGDEESLLSLSPEQRKAHGRIQALLKKAESTSFEKEAEALVEKAESLRQQYRIENLLSVSYSGSAKQNNVISARVRLRAPWVKYQVRLLSTIARSNSCESLLLTPSGIATVFGTADDVGHVIDLFTSLNRQREHFMRTSAGARTAQERSETSSYRRSFMVAYANRVGSILRRAAKDVMDNLGETAPSAPGSVLPVLHERSKRAQQTIDSIFPNTRNMSVSTNNLLGYQDGYAAAGKSHFGGDSSGLSGQRQLTDGVHPDHFPT